MKRTFEIQMISLAAVALLSVTPHAHAQECAPHAAMQLAHSRELTAQAQYIAWAARAELEGRPEVACLFRAVARAESIHAAREATVLAQELDGDPVGGPAQCKVLGTADNLRMAIECERFERGRVYPMIEECLRRMNKYGCLWWCTRARCAEATHEKVFALALGVLAGEAAADVENADAVQTGFEPRLFPDRWFLCPGCGVVSVHPMKCDNCNTGLACITVSCEP